jgi:hypothetical protein
LIPESSRELRLLWLAGSATVYARAGAIAATTTLPAMAQDDILPQAPATTVPLLRPAIDGELEALAQWMTQRMAKAGVRLPDALLPAALNQRDTQQTAHWLPVLGERGRWLAQQNPHWNKLLADAQAGEEANLQQAWEEGSNPQRRAALIVQRKLDPAIARGWVAAALPKEKADQRLQWVEALEAGLSQDDAGLLEQQLDDRSQGVRAAAAALLARLPASDCATRLRQRASTCVRWEAAAKPGMLGRLIGTNAKLQLQVEPPTELPKDWERDGINTNPPGGEGKRAFWLRQLLGLIDPNIWGEATNAAPSELLSVMQKNEWAEALLHGAAAAAHRFAHGEWASALLALQASNRQNYLVQYESGLWQVLTEDTRRNAIKARLAAGDLQGAFDGLQHCARPWPQELTRQAINKLPHVKPGTAPDVFQTLIRMQEQCLLHGAEEALPALATSITESQAGTEVQDWSSGMRVKLAQRISTLYQAKLQFIKEMPL